MGLQTRVMGGAYNSVALTIFWVSLHAQIGLAASAGTPAASKVESLDALYQKAKQEGRVVVYAATSTKTEEVVFPAFEKRFPGIKVNHVNATADKLVARAIAEARSVKREWRALTPRHTREQRDAQGLSDMRYAKR